MTVQMQDGSGSGTLDGVIAGQGQMADALRQLADGQERSVAAQERLIEVIETQGSGDGIDAESRMRLRSIDVQMLRILEEISAGRQETMSEIRTDLSALAAALNAGGQTRRTTTTQTRKKTDGRTG